MANDGLYFGFPLCGKCGDFKGENPVNIPGMLGYQYLCRPCLAEFGDIFKAWFEKEEESDVGSD